MSKHNTPWTYGNSLIIKDSTGAMIADVLGSTIAIAEDRASYILTAVNNHERLVEALEAAQRFLPSPDSLPYKTRTEIGDAVNLVNAALAAVKGEGEGEG